MNDLVLSSFILFVLCNKAIEDSRPAMLMRLVLPGDKQQREQDEA